MNYNIEHFGGILGKASKEEKDKISSDQLNLYNQNCKNTHGEKFAYDLKKEKCIKIVTYKESKEKDIKEKAKEDIKEKSKEDIKEKSKEDIKVETDEVNKQTNKPIEKNCKGISDCNYNGKCVNGLCECDVNYDGKYCQNNLCEGIDCKNGFCEGGICKCFPGWELEKNSLNQMICKKEKCYKNKCGKYEGRGKCIISNDIKKDGSCECNEGWSGDYCDYNKCIELKYDAKLKKHIYSPKCKNNSFCDKKTDKCICNVLNIYENDCERDESGECIIDKNKHFIGSKCERNLCVNKDGNFKCNNGKCDLFTGECTCDFGYNKEDNCKKKGCPDCKNGKCKKIGGNNQKGIFACECNKGWFLDSSGICSINNCLKKDENGNYIKNKLTDRFEKMCNEDTSKCILDSNNNFSKCECLDNFDKSDPNSNDCDKCKGDYQNYPECNVISCERDDINLYLDRVTEECKINKCKVPAGCNKDSAAVSTGDKIDRCKIHQGGQCKIKGCLKGYHYVPKLCYNKNDEEISCDNEMLENFGNIEKFSSDTLDSNYDYNEYVSNLQEGYKETCESLDQDLITLSKEECKIHASNNGKVLKEITGWYNYPKGCLKWDNEYYYSNSILNNKNGVPHYSSSCTGSSKCICKKLSSSKGACYAGINGECHDNSGNGHTQEDCLNWLENKDIIPELNDLVWKENKNCDELPTVINSQTMCLNGLGGQCFDNVDKETCLNLSENKKNYSYNDIDGNYINVQKNFVDSLVFQENKTCQNFINEYDKCFNDIDDWRENPTKKNLSVDCYKQIWLNLGCNPKDSYVSSWSDNRNFKQNFTDFAQWRARDCGSYGIQEETITKKQIINKKNSTITKKIKITKKPTITKNPKITKKQIISDINEDNKIKRIEYGQCKVNKCKCRFGVGTISEECNINGTEKCKSCNEGYFKTFLTKEDLDNDDFICTRCSRPGDYITGDICKNCMTHGCENGGICNDDNKCECSSNFIGNFCNMCKGDLEGESCDRNRCNFLHSNALSCSSINQYGTCNQIKGECECNCINGNCDKESGVCICPAMSYLEGERCNINQCDTQHSDSYHNKCKNGSICKVLDNGSAECDCTGTNFYGEFCDKVINENLINSCVLNNGNINTEIDFCNYTTDKVIEDYCKTIQKKFIIKNGIKKCLDHLIKPKLYLHQKSNNYVIIKIVFDINNPNNKYQNYYIPHIEELGINYILTDVTNNLVFDDNLNTLTETFDNVELSNNETVSPNNNETVSPNNNETVSPNNNISDSINSVVYKPVIKFYNNLSCDNERCRFIKINNLKLFTLYKLKLKYSYEFDESIFSEIISFKTECNKLEIDVCKFKCGENKDEECGPSNNNPNVSNNKRDSDVFYWPYFRKFVSSDDYCGCSKLDNKEKELLCNNISNKSDQDYKYFNNECKKQLTNNDCINDRIGLDPVYHKYFIKIPDVNTNYTSCVLESNLEEKCTERGGIFNDNKCYPKLDPLTIDSFKELSDKIEFQITSKINLNDYDLIYNIYGDSNENKTNELLKVNTSENGYKCNDECKIRRWSTEKKTCNVDKYYYKSKEYTWDYCRDDRYKFSVYGLSENKNYNIKCKINHKYIKNTDESGKEKYYGSDYSTYLSFKTKCNNSLYTFSSCKSNFGPKIGEVNNYIKDSRAVDKWPYFLINSEDNCSCVNFNDEQRKNYCEGKNKEGFYNFTDHKFYNEKCLKVLSNEECKKKTPKTENILFSYKPDSDTKNTSCRELSINEKKDICDKTLEKVWWINPTNPLDISCRNKINIGSIEEYEIKNNFCKFILRYGKINDKDVNKINVFYTLYDNLNNIIKNDVKVEELEIITTDPENPYLIFKISRLDHDTNYKIRAIIKTNIVDYESDFSEKLSFNTLCDSSLYSDEICKNNFGPVDLNVSTVINNKDPSVDKWPYFKISNKICGCREYTDKERIKLCKQSLNSSSDLKNKTTPAPLIDIDIDLLNSSNGICQHKIKPVGPVSNLSIKSLDINQEVESLEENYNIVNKNTNNKFKYRLLLSWNTPDIDYNYVIYRGSVKPVSYDIYRSLDNSNFTKIHSFTINNNNTSHFWIDGDNKLYPSNVLTKNVLLGNMKYYYKIIPINSAGEYNGKNLVISGTTIPVRLTASDCNEFEDFYSDAPKYKNNKEFKGFKKVLNTNTNSCDSMPNIQRIQVCKNLKKIDDVYSNTYNPTKKKCEPMVTPVTPGDPGLDIINYGYDFVELNLTAPTKLGVPPHTHYLLKSKKEGEDEIVLLDKVTSSPLITKKGQNQKYRVSVLPGFTYTYSLEAISKDDEVWSIVDSPVEFDGGFIGRSGNPIIKTVTTNFTLPKLKKNIQKSTVTNDSIKIIVDNNTVQTSNILLLGGKGAVISKTKITKYIIKDSVRLPDFEEYEYLNLNDLRKNKFLEVKDIGNNKIEITDYNVDPNSMYEYKVQIRNDKVNEYSKQYNSVIITTNQKNPIRSISGKLNLKNSNITFSHTKKNLFVFKCKIDKNIEIKSTTTKINLFIDPNISYYQLNKNIKSKVLVNSIYKHLLTELFVYYRKLGTTNVKIEKIIVDSGKDINITIDNFEPESDYKISFLVRHKGRITLKNGYIDDVICDNILDYDKEENSYIIKVPKITEEDCKSRDIYRQRGLISYNNLDEPVYYYLDTTSHPNICKERQHKQLTDWCRSYKENGKLKYGNDYVYKIESGIGLCAEPSDALWQVSYNLDVVGTEEKKCKLKYDSENGILCNGGRRVKKIWEYVAAQNGGESPNIPSEIETEDNKNLIDNNFGLNSDFVNYDSLVTTKCNPGFDCKLYLYEDCNEVSCKNMCENDYNFWAGEKDFKVPLNDNISSTHSFYADDKCIKKNIINPQISKVFMSTKCTNQICGNPENSIERVKYKCIDGSYGPISKTSCKSIKNLPIIFTDDDELDTKINLDDGTTISVKQYEKEIDIKCSDYNSTTSGTFNWCEWTKGDYDECTSDINNSTRCVVDSETSSQSRTVECPKSNGCCNTSSCPEKYKKPNSNRSCTLEKCPKNCVYDGGWIFENQCYVNESINSNKEFCNGGKKRKKRKIQVHSNENETNLDVTNPCSQNQIKEGGSDYEYEWVNCNLNINCQNGVCENSTNNYNCNCNVNFIKKNSDKCNTLSCPEWTHPRADGTGCDENICRCDNGHGIVGVGCYAHNAHHCSGCIDSGGETYTLYPITKRCNLDQRNCTLKNLNPPWVVDSNDNQKIGKDYYRYGDEVPLSVVMDYTKIGNIHPDHTHVEQRKVRYKRTFEVDKKQNYLGLNCVNAFNLLDLEQQKKSNGDENKFIEYKNEWISVNDSDLPTELRNRLYWVPRSFYLGGGGNEKKTFNADHDNPRARLKWAIKRGMEFETDTRTNVGVACDNRAGSQGNCVGTFTYPFDSDGPRKQGWNEGNHWWYNWYVMNERTNDFPNYTWVDVFSGKDDGRLWSYDDIF
jgi:hypothetical protein